MMCMDVDSNQVDQVAHVEGVVKEIHVLQLTAAMYLVV